MLLTYALLNCRMDPYIWDAPSQFPIIDAWAQRLTGKGYRLQSVGNPNVAGDPDVYTYDYRGTVMRVKVIRFAMFAGSRNVQGCLWVPSSISVLDTTIDPSGKSATVTFRYGPKTATPLCCRHVRAVSYSVCRRARGRDVGRLDG